MYSNNNIKTPYKDLPTLQNIRKYYSHFRNIKDQPVPVLVAEYHLMYFLGTVSQDSTIETYLEVLLNEIRGKCE